MKITRKLLYVMLVLMVLNVFFPVNVFGSNISSDSLQFNGHSYKLFDMDFTWYEAKAYCEKLGGHLAIITSENEQVFIESLVKNSNRKVFWLGGSDEFVEGTWKWVDGSNFVYSNWSSGEPNNEYNEDFLVIYNSNSGRGSLGKWNDINNEGSIWKASSNKGFICEWDNVSNINFNNLQNISATGIPKSAFEFNGHSYFVYEQEMSWIDAKQYCERLGGTLVTITSQSEQNFINDLINGNKRSNYWIGANDISSEGNWQWVTGEKFSFSNWDKGEPNNQGGNEDYALIHKSTRLWNDGDQYLGFDFGFICEWKFVIKR